MANHTAITSPHLNSLQQGPDFPYSSRLRAQSLFLYLDSFIGPVLQNPWLKAELYVTSPPCCTSNWVSFKLLISWPNYSLGWHKTTMHSGERPNLKFCIQETAQPLGRNQILAPILRQFNTEPFQSTSALSKRTLLLPCTLLNLLSVRKS